MSWFVTEATPASRTPRCSLGLWKFPSLREVPVQISNTLEGGGEPAEAGLCMTLVELRCLEATGQIWEH